MVDKQREILSSEMFRSGFHCSQVVVSFYAEQFGLNRETALKLSCPFGGGLGGLGRTCGAVTGGLIVLGLKHGYSSATEVDRKELVRRKARQFIERFEEKFQTSGCNELMGFDRSNLPPEELRARRPIFDEKCPVFISEVFSILDELL